MPNVNPDRVWNKCDVTPCERCGRKEYVCWSSPNLLWDLVVDRSPKGKKLYASICIPCFDRLAYGRGLDLQWDVAVVGASRQENGIRYTDRIKYPRSGTSLITEREIAIIRRYRNAKP